MVRQQAIVEVNVFMVCLLWRLRNVRISVNLSYCPLQLEVKGGMRVLTTCRAANRYDFCRIITIFCLSLRHYAHTLKYYDKSSIFPVIISLGPYPPFYHPHERRNHASWTRPASGACAQKILCGIAIAADEATPLFHYCL